MSEKKAEQEVPQENYTIFHALFEAAKKKEEKKPKSLLHRILGKQS